MQNTASAFTLSFWYMASSSSRACFLVCSSMEAPLVVAAPPSVPSKPPPLLLVRPLLLLLLARPKDVLVELRAVSTDSNCWLLRCRGVGECCVVCYGAIKEMGRGVMNVYGKYTVNGQKECMMNV